MSDATDREIVTRRTVLHPISRVFAAWMEPERLARWWGPKGFTSTFETFDPRPGGQWRFVMHGPNGANFPNHNAFLEVTPERIVIDHHSNPSFRITATFDPAPGGTAITFRGTFASKVECDKVRGFAVPANEEMFDRLEAELARMAAGS